KDKKLIPAPTSNVSITRNRASFFEKKIGRVSSGCVCKDGTVTGTTACPCSGGVKELIGASRASLTASTGDTVCGRACNPFDVSSCGGACNACQNCSTDKKR